MHILINLINLNAFKIAEPTGLFQRTLEYSVLNPLQGALLTPQVLSHTHALPLPFLTLEIQIKTFKHISGIF